MLQCQADPCTGSNQHHPSTLNDLLCNKLQLLVSWWFAAGYPQRIFVKFIFGSSRLHFPCSLPLLSIAAHPVCNPSNLPPFAPTHSKGALEHLTRVTYPVMCLYPVHYANLPISRSS